MWATSGSTGGRARIRRATISVATAKRSSQDGAARSLSSASRASRPQTSSSGTTDPVSSAGAPRRAAAATGSSRICRHAPIRPPALRSPGMRPMTALPRSRRSPLRYAMPSPSLKSMIRVTDGCATMAMSPSMGTREPNPAMLTPGRPAPGSRPGTRGTATSTQAQSQSDDVPVGGT